MTSHHNFDLYQELEVSKDATVEEIKKSYKKLALVSNLHNWSEMAS